MVFIKVFIGIFVFVIDVWVSTVKGLEKDVDQLCVQLSLLNNSIELYKEEE